MSSQLLLLIMKIRLLSDLHLEFGAFEPPRVEADVVVLAGDIHTKAGGVRWAQERFETVPVVYVPGNHEYYGGSLGHTWDKMKQAALGSNVHLLDNEVLDVGDVRFVGCTLWTDYRLTGNEPLAMWDAQQRLNDYKQVRDEQFRKVRPKQLQDRHARSRQFLREALESAEGRKVVVVTHHGASSLSIAPEYRDDKSHLNACYASAMENFMGEPVVLWLHGHTHASLDYDIAGTRVVCNPRGYAPSDTNRDFDPCLVLEV